MDDDAISGFAAITDASPSVARHYLMLTDGNMEQAIQLFFDSPDLAASVSASQTARPATRPPRTSGHPDVIEIDSDDDMDEDSDNNAPTTTGQNHLEDDEAMARRMQDEMYGAAGPVSGSIEDDVRAPIARTTETLVGPGASWGVGDDDDRHAAILEQLRRRGGPSGGRKSCLRVLPEHLTNVLHHIQVDKVSSVNKKNHPYGERIPQRLEEVDLE